MNRKEGFVEVFVSFFFLINFFFFVELLLFWEFFIIIIFFHFWGFGTFSFFLIKIWDIF